MNNASARNIRDIFDELLPSDIFDSVSSDKLEDVFSELENEKHKLSSEIKNLVKSEVGKLSPTRQVQQVVKHEQTVRHVQVPMEPKVIKAPPQIIREVRVEVPAKDTKKYAEEKTVAELKAELAGLQEKYERLVETLPMMGGPGVIGIPPPEAAPDTYVLTNDKGKAKWKASSGGAPIANGVISRTGNYISSVLIQGVKTITLTRDANNYITSSSDGNNTWTFTRNASNQITSWTVS